ncbi:PREDICTED: uncharacterized protein LOC109337544 [Lupinus angustifolius]|uniref:uncharacterized protein LOC109337544 n=1 Tax=Lupinus angustifolius TaxID=3871 RepID=UPI00092FB017|nr:PREDICTED: uncharacterized protein LOC109337544 [Lupinus angustifolius]
MNPPVLVPPVPRNPLIMYLTVLEESMGCMLGQHNESGKKQQAIYYLSKKFTSCETRYSMLERTCCALVWAARRLQQYMLSHTTWLVSKMDPLKYIFEKPALTGRISRWQVMLSKYDIVYVTQKAVKGSALANYLASQPIEDYESMQYDFLDEDIMSLFSEESEKEKWTLVFDGASNALGHGIGAVLISLEDKFIPITPRLCFDCTNNIAEYEACALRIQAALDSKASVLESLIGQFDEITFHHIPREDNQLADALSTLSSMFKVSEDDLPLIKMEKLSHLAYCQVIEEESYGKPWTHDIKQFIKSREYPPGATKNDKRTLRRLVMGFFLNEDGCLEPMQVGTPWLFSMWGMDVIGPIESKASNGHRFILVAIDYFTKWVEAAFYASVTRHVVLRFIKKELRYRYGLPSKIIIDNATNLNNKMMSEMCEEFNIKHHNSSPYRPKMYGVVEATNKNIKKIVQKMVVTYKDWHEMLPFSRRGYRTSVRTSTRATLYSLVYGMEAVLPIEVQIPSLRVIMEAKLEDVEWVEARVDQLNLIEGKRLTTICHGQLYQRKIMKAHEKKIQPREFQEGELVLKKILPTHKDSRGKWTPNYEGPYVVKRAFFGGALILTNMDSEDMPLPVNSGAVKKYYA